MSEFVPKHPLASTFMMIFAVIVMISSLITTAATSAGAQDGLTKINGIWGHGPVTSVRIIDSGDVLYNYGTYLRTADFSNPDSPVVTREILTKISGIDQIFYHDDFFFAASSEHRDRLTYYYQDVDRAFENYSGSVTGSQFRIHGDLGFAFNLQNFSVYDAGNPSDQISLIRTVGIDITRPDVVRAYDIVGDKAYVATNENLHVVDLSDREDIRETLKIPLGTRMTADSNIRVIDDYLFRVSSGNVHIYDISDPSDPQELAVIDASDGLNISTIAVDGDLLYLLANSTAVSGPGELLVYDITDLENPVLAEAIQPDLELYDFDVHEGALFIAAGATGLLHYQLDEDNTAEWVSTIPATGNLQDVWHHNDMAFVLTQDSVLHVVDVADHMAPATLGHVRVTGVTQLSPFDEETLIVTSETGFELIDISDPVSPEVVSIYTFDGQKMSNVHATARGNHVFLDISDANRESRFEAVDISDFSNPVLSSTQNLSVISSAPRYPLVYGDYLLSVRRVGGGHLRIFDISDPDEVTIVRSQPIRPITSPQIYNDYLVGAEGADLLFYDLSDITFVWRSAIYSAPQDLKGVMIQDDMAFAAVIGNSASNAFLYTLDISDPEEVEPAVVYAFEEWPESVFLPTQAGLLGANSDMTILGRTGGPGFYIYQTGLREPTGIEDITDSDDFGRELPGSLILKPNYPNPFNPTTSIRFYLPVQSDLTLSLYNAAGQRVAEIAKGRFDAGKHSIAFDGSGLSSGVYLYRLQTPYQSATRRMTLVK